MRKRGRVDANQTKVVDHLRRAGLSVAVTSGVGNGFPDLVVAGFVSLRIGAMAFSINTIHDKVKTLLVELKDPDQPPSKRMLTPAEIKFRETWKGEYIKATTAEEILNHFNK